MKDDFSFDIREIDHELTQLSNKIAQSNIDEKGQSFLQTICLFFYSSFTILDEEKFIEIYDKANEYAEKFLTMPFNNN